VKPTLSQQTSRALVVYAYNTSYVEGIGRRIMVQDPIPCQNRKKKKKEKRKKEKKRNPARPYLKTEAKKVWGMA
jgi:hypothetical protein